MPLIEEGPLYANLTLSITRKAGDDLVVNQDAPAVGARYVAAIIQPFAKNTSLQITDAKPTPVKVTKTGWRFWVTFAMPSVPQLRLIVLEMLRKTVDGPDFPEIDILNGTLSYYDDDGIYVSRRVEEGTREHGALFNKPFVKGLKVGDSRRMNSEKNYLPRKVSRSRSQWHRPGGRQQRRKNRGGRQSRAPCGGATSELRKPIIIRSQRYHMIRAVIRLDCFGPPFSYLCLFPYWSLFSLFVLCARSLVQLASDYYGVEGMNISVPLLSRRSFFH
jgi:hypothetical protein